MELIQKQVHYTQEGKRTFDQFYLDEDLNVPDTKDDVKQIIQGDRVGEGGGDPAHRELSADLRKAVLSDLIYDGLSRDAACGAGRETSL